MRCRRVIGADEVLQLLFLLERGVELDGSRFGFADTQFREVFLVRQPSFRCIMDVLRLLFSVNLTNWIFSSSVKSAELNGFDLTNGLPVNIDGWLGLLFHDVTVLEFVQNVTDKGALYKPHLTR